MATSAVANNPYADLGLATAVPQAAKKSLGQEDFLKLMTTQLQYQDPFKPMENGEFLGQMAQFSTVSSIQELQTSFAQLAGSLQSSQALQASSLVGRHVLVPATSGYLGDTEALAGAVEIPASGRVSVQVSDASGQVVRRLDLGTQPAGLATFNWNGVSDLGEELASGIYKITAQLDNGSAQQSLDTYAVGRVDSVAVNGSELTLDLRGMASVPFAQIRQIL